MTEQEKILKELRKKEFQSNMKDKEVLSSFIAQTLQIDEDYVKNNIILEPTDEYDPYDLVTKVTETRIKIKTSKFNKMIRYLEENKYYTIRYDETRQEYKIKIYLDKIFDDKYKIISKEHNKRIRELFQDEQLTKEQINDIMIAELGIKYAKKLKISISGII